MNHFLTIQYLRGVAAILVVVFHVAVIFSKGSWAFSDGRAGVDIFFVISGFVMWVSARGSQPGQFLLRRILRIAPLYWAVTLFVAFVTIEGGVRIGLGEPVGDIIRSLFFIAYDNPPARPSVSPIVGPGWTLNLEMFFYVIFAICLLMFRSGLAWAIFTILFVIAVAGLMLPPGYPVLAFYLDTIVIEFGLGVLLGWYVMRGHPLPGFPLALLMVAAGAFWIFSDLLTSDMRLLDFGVGAFLIVAGGVALDPLISRRPVPMLRHLGDASYSIYLTHILTIGATKSILAPATGAIGLVLDVAIVLICAVVGSAVFLCYERPVGRTLKMLLMPRGKVNTLAVSAETGSGSHT